MKHSLTVIAVLAAFATAPATAVAQRQQTEPKAFEWSGELARGQRVIVRSVNGGIAVEPASGRTMEIVAAKKWRRGKPGNVTIEAARVSGGDVLMCVKWTPRTECTENSYSSRGSWDNNNDTSVEITIKLPAGSNAVLNTTNGEIEVTGASGAIDAHTTNGELNLETSDGQVDAHTTNGNIDVRVGRMLARSAAFRTINGSITLALPVDAGAEINARTTNGRISCDFPVTVVGSMSRQTLRGTIGRGGPVITISTTNGSVRIEKQ